MSGVRWCVEVEPLADPAAEALEELRRVLWRAMSLAGGPATWGTIEDTVQDMADADEQRRTERWELR